MFLPSWSQTWTAAQATNELTNFTFRGPGWYEANGDAMLVIPLDREPQDTWNQAHKEDERFRFHIFNGNTIGEIAVQLNLLIHAPER